MKIFRTFILANVIFAQSEREKIRQKRRDQVNGDADLNEQQAKVQ